MNKTKNFLLKIKQLYNVVFKKLENITEEDSAYISQKCNDIIAKIPEIDEAINGATTGWKTTRMGKVDLSIIRLAVYEIKYEEDVPAKVAINEAVELAKLYGTDNSASFEIIKHSERPT